MRSTTNLDSKCSNPTKQNYNRAQEQNKRAAGQLNINDNVIILGGNKQKLEQQAAPEANQKPADASAQGGRHQQLSKLDDQGQAEGENQPLPTAPRPARRLQRGRRRRGSAEGLTSDSESTLHHHGQQRTRQRL